MKIQQQSKIKPYFQQQGFFSMQCGLCAVNNLLGQKKFKTNEFVQICKNLEKQYQSSYKHFFGGDYDVSVLISALQNKGFDIQWHDARKSLVLDQNVLKQDNQFIGYLLNFKKEKFYHKILNLSGRHWVSVKFQRKETGKIECYYLDSVTKNPQIKSIDDIRDSLNKQLKNEGTILRVYDKNIERSVKENKQLQQDDVIPMDQENDRIKYIN